MRRIRYGVVLIGCIAGFIGGFCGNKIATKDTKSTMELGMKVSDFKWLLNEGKISEGEVIKFQNATSTEELDEVLDSILQDKDVPGKISIN